MRFVVEILISIRPSASALIGVRRRQTGAGCSRWPEITNIDPQRIPTVPNGVPRGAVAVLTFSRRIGSDRTKVALISSSKSYSTFRGSYTRSNCSHRNEPKASNITHILIKFTNQIGGGRLEASKEIKGGARLRGGAVLPCPASDHYPGM